MTAKAKRYVLIEAPFLVLRALFSYDSWMIGRCHKDEESVKCFLRVVRMCSVPAETVAKLEHWLRAQAAVHPTVSHKDGNPEPFGIKPTSNERSAKDEQ